MRRVKIISRSQWDIPRGILFLTVVVCLSLLATGCAPSAEEPAKVQVKPEEQVPEPAVETIKPTVQPEEKVPKAETQEVTKPQVEPKEKMPAVEPRGGEPVELALKFTPQDSTNYSVTVESQRSIKGEGSLANDSTFKGGTTSSRIEMIFTQQIKSVDDKGNAIAKVIIKGLKYLTVEKNNIVMDFDSSKESDLNNPLAVLIGQSYTIGITPSGHVSKVIDATQAQAAAKGASERAIQLLSADAIKERHEIPALSACDKKQLRRGDNWSSIKTFSFGMMGSKSLERIYTLKEIRDVNNRRFAIIEMDAIPSAGMAEDLQKEQAMGIFSKMFDNTDMYTGRLILELNAGKVEEYSEKLLSEWTAVGPLAEQKDNEEPAVLKMTAIRLYYIEKID